MTTPVSRAPAWVTATPIAHRGLHDMTRGIPENSLAAFAAAADAGYAAELDVWLSRDRVPVVFHDTDVSRLTGATGLVREFSASELGRLRLLGTDEPIPTLAAVLDAVAGRVPLFLELKAHQGRTDGIEPAVAELLESYTGRVAVISFHPLALRWFRRNRPDIPRGQTSSDFRDVVLNPAVLKAALRDFRLNGLSRPHFVTYDLRALPSAPASRVRAAGLPLIAWTVRNAADLDRAVALADQYVFEGMRPYHGATETAP